MLVEIFDGWSWHSGAVKSCTDTLFELIELASDMLLVFGQRERLVELIKRLCLLGRGVKRGFALLGLAGVD